MVITALVILAAVVVVASGRGGELAYEHADHAPLDMGPVSAADVALLRPPSALWGYNMQVTDEALDRIARAMSERDIQIAALQQQVADLQAAGLGTTAPSPAARHAVRQPEADSSESGSSAESWLTENSLTDAGEPASAPYPPALVSAAEPAEQTPEETTAPDAWNVPDLTDEPADAVDTSSDAAAADAWAPAGAGGAADPADAADSVHLVGANGHLTEPGAAQEAETDQEEADSTDESAGKEAGSQHG